MSGRSSFGCFIAVQVFVAHIRIHLSSYKNGCILSVRDFGINEIDMCVVAAILLIVAACADAGGQPSADKTPPERRESNKDIVIIANGKTVPEYLYQNTFQIVPVYNSATNKRASRRDDQILGWRLEFTKPTPQEAAKIVDKISTKSNSKRSPQKANTSTVRRNDKDGNPEVTTVQRIKSGDGVVAVPVSVPQKGKTSIFSATQVNENGIQYADNFDSSPFLPSKGVPDSKSGVLLSGKTVSAITSPVAVNKVQLPGTLYQLKPSPVVPTLVGDFSPYTFGYGIDDGFGSSQFRRESAAQDGTITGNYGYKDYQGIFRHVNYIADKDGFRAVMRTNEPSVLPVDSADVSVIVDPPPPSVFVVPSENYVKDIAIS